MPNKTQSVFRSAALLSGQVTQEQLDCADAAVRAAVGGSPTAEVTDQQLADKLFEMEVITRYQADQMLEGRNKLNLGPYIVTDFIGQGGMGRVYKAVHPVMGRECAIKILPLEKATSESIEHFTREIRTQAKLDHPNLVRAFDAGKNIAAAGKAKKITRVVFDRGGFVYTGSVKAFADGAREGGLAF